MNQGLAVMEGCEERRRMLYTFAESQERHRVVTDDKVPVKKRTQEKEWSWERRWGNQFPSCDVWASA